MYAALFITNIKIVFMYWKLFDIVIFLLILIERIIYIHFVDMKSIMFLKSILYSKQIQNITLYSHEFLKFIINLFYLQTGNIDTNAVFNKLWL